LIFVERRVLVIIVRITMNILIEKRTEVMQTLLSMIEPTENGRDCLSCHVSRDIEDKNVFSLIEEWRSFMRSVIKKANSFSMIKGNSYETTPNGTVS
jgi:hypothetical protein